jgi:small-conductance mechanosensitive channel
MLAYLAHTFHLPVSVTYVILLGGLALGAVALGLIARRVLTRWAKGLHPGWERITAEALESLTLPLLFIASMDLALEVLSLPRTYARMVHVFVFAVSLVVVFNFLGKVVGIFIRNLLRDDAAFSRVIQPATLFARAVLGIIALVIFLENVGVSLTAVWTTLGVGSVAIGLALQATLSNFFAGITLLADRPISPGDHILLGPGGSGLEGEVVRIGWRATEVQTPTNETAFIPNSTMASTILTNYSLKGSGAVVTIPVKLNVGIDIEKSEAVLLETAKDVFKQLKLPADPQPEVALTSDFTDPFIQLSLKAPVPRLADREVVANELRKAITARYRQGELKSP